MLQEPPSPTELLAATAAVKKQKALSAYGLATAQEFLDAKKTEAKLLIRALYPGTDENMPTWAAHIQQELQQIQEGQRLSQEGQLQMQRVLVQLSEQIASLSTAVGKIDARLIRVENRYSFTNTNERLIQEISNASGIAPSSTDLPRLTDASDLDSLPSEATKDYLRFYGLRVANSVEKNKAALKTHLGVPLVP